MAQAQGNSKEACEALHGKVCLGFCCENYICDLNWPSVINPMINIRGVIICLQCDIEMLIPVGYGKITDKRGGAAMQNTINAQLIALSPDLYLCARSKGRENRALCGLPRPVDHRQAAHHRWRSTLQGRRQAVLLGRALRASMRRGGALPDRLILRHLPPRETGAMAWSGGP